jgi:hypothetical protein
VGSYRFFVRFPSSIPTRQQFTTRYNLPTERARLRDEPDSNPLAFPLSSGRESLGPRRFMT